MSIHHPTPETTNNTTVNCRPSRPSSPPLPLETLGSLATSCSPSPGRVGEVQVNMTKEKAGNYYCSANLARKRPCCSTPGIASLASYEVLRACVCAAKDIVDLLLLNWRRVWRDYIVAARGDT
ncbi:unnamed protein product, partial [Ectocarpus sp. 12 AP-2014]